MTDTAGIPFTDLQRDVWSRVAARYHAGLGPVTVRAADPLLDLAGVGPGDRVLDVATGPCYFAGRAVARGASVVGVDLAPDMLTLARRLVPAGTFELGSADDLPFRAASFDAADAGFLVPHLPAPDAVASELARVVRPGGVVGLSTWGPHRRHPSWLRS